MACPTLSPGPSPGSPGSRECWDRSDCCRSSHRRSRPRTWPDSTRSHKSAVDRLLNSAYELVLDGESYRRRQKPVPGSSFWQRVVPALWQATHGRLELCYLVASLEPSTVPTVHAARSRSGRPVARVARRVRAVVVAARPTRLGRRRVVTPVGLGVGVVVRPRMFGLGSTGRRGHLTSVANTRSPDNGDR